MLDRPLFGTADYPELGGNINGPSLIKVPAWIKNPLGRYYLYFAHHEGDHIRLAYSDALTGPWHLFTPGTLHLRESGFCQRPPSADETHPDVLAMIDAGIDGDYAHIASPDVHIDQQSKQLIMYFHGRLSNGTQATKLALSRDGINFKAQDELLGLSYFRVFFYHDFVYAVALNSVLYRSRNGLTNFAQGPGLTDQKFRHGAILKLNDTVYVIWTRAEDCPERLLISRLDTTGDWSNWALADTQELRRPVQGWEGANLVMQASRYGGLMSPAHQLRDPCVYQEKAHTYVVYSIAGEQGLAIGELLTS